MKILVTGSAIVIKNPSALPIFQGPVPPRIRFFEVYYLDPPVVGFHVIGAKENEVDQ